MSITSKLKERNNAIKEQKKSFLKILEKKCLNTRKRKRLNKTNRNTRYEQAKCPVKESE